MLPTQISIYTCFLHYSLGGTGSGRGSAQNKDFKFITFHGGSECSGLNIDETFFYITCWGEGCAPAKIVILHYTVVAMSNVICGPNTWHMVVVGGGLRTIFYANFMPPHVMGWSGLENLDSASFLHPQVGCARGLDIFNSEKKKTTNVNIILLILYTRVFFIEYILSRTFLLQYNVKLMLYTPNTSWV